MNKEERQEWERSLKKFERFYDIALEEAENRPYSEVAKDLFLALLNILDCVYFEEKNNSLKKLMIRNTIKNMADNGLAFVEEMYEKTKEEMEQAYAKGVAFQESFWSDAQLDRGFKEGDGTFLRGTIEGIKKEISEEKDPE